jgi:hypothetical protein
VRPADGRGRTPELCDVDGDRRPFVGQSTEAATGRLRAVRRRPASQKDASHGRLITILGSAISSSMPPQAALCLSLRACPTLDHGEGLPICPSSRGCSIRSTGPPPSGSVGPISRLPASGVKTRAGRHIPALGTTLPLERCLSPLWQSSQGTTAGRMVEESHQVRDSWPAAIRTSTRSTISCRMTWSRPSPAPVRRLQPGYLTHRARTTSADAARNLGAAAFAGV